ncbi:MAG: membrane protease YdiL (CAAX protease family) [Polyangiales bacterium]
MAKTGKHKKTAKPKSEPAVVSEHGEPTTWTARFASLHPKRLFGETWAAADERAATEKVRRKAEGLGTDWRPFWAMVLAGMVLTFLRYYGTTDGFIQWSRAQVVDEAAWEALRNSPDFAFNSKAWWAGWRVIGYVFVPALFIKFVMKERVVDYGLSLKGVKDHAWIYGLGFGIVVIAVFFVSFDTAFQNKYPMYENAGRSYRDLLIWELIYAAQFFALEFFFRGYWLKTCERVMGGHAVTCMVVPYCMIHFGKPWPETIGAIFAGLLLGTLVLRYRSIWAGVIVHISVAVSMDVLSLWQKGQLPSVW